MVNRTVASSIINSTILCLILIILFVSPGITARRLAGDGENGGGEQSNSGVHGSRSSPAHSVIGNGTSNADIPHFYREDENGNLVPIPVVIANPCKPEQKC